MLLSRLVIGKVLFGLSLKMVRLRCIVVVCIECGLRLMMMIRVLVILEVVKVLLRCLL